PTVAQVLPVLRGNENNRQQQEQQKQVQADTDHLVRRIGTMLRVLQYYQLDQGAEKKLLDEVVTTLSGLSRNQMAKVIDRLDKAAKAPDDKTGSAQLQRAYQKHREIVSTLRGLLSKYDA